MNKMIQKPTTDEILKVLDYLLMIWKGDVGIGYIYSIYLKEKEKQK